MNNKPSKKGLYAAITGTVVVALCCFTPILVIAVGTVGLASLTPYLDYVLFPALAVMIVVTVLSYRKYKNGCAECQTFAVQSEAEDATAEADTQQSETAQLTCPHCQHIQTVIIPQTGCLAFHKCEKCDKLISVPKGSDNCCVICEYADKKCPVAR